MRLLMEKSETGPQAGGQAEKSKQKVHMERNHLISSYVEADIEAALKGFGLDKIALNSKWE